LDGFITQLGQFIAQQPKEALAATAAETAYVIRLMTIHQAKGLQFPLVVVPDLDRPPRIGAPPAAVDAELGPVVSLPSDDEREKCTTGMSMYSARERQAELEERKRLLYVACTRAADYLILSSSVESCDAPKSDWMQLLAGRFDLATGALVGELPHGYGRPAARVTLSEPATEFSAVGTPRGANLLDVLEAARDAQPGRAAGLVRGVGSVPYDRMARRQFSFSRLTGKLVRRERYVEADAEIRELQEHDEATVEEQDDGRLGGIQFGSLVHNVLQRVDFAKQLDRDAIRAWCEHLAPLYVYRDAAGAANLAAELIARLAESPRGRAMSLASSMHREVEFLLNWTGGRYLQGYIDALYQGDDGKWRIVDYKSNEVSRNAIASEAARYEMQLCVYALAVEHALGVSPAELVLYFLRPGEEYVFPWSDTARERVREMVDRALNASFGDLDR
jgi:ATP-dependent helicase/nuclease subunit A